MIIKSFLCFAFFFYYILYVILFKKYFFNANKKTVNVKDNNYFII